MSYQSDKKIEQEPVAFRHYLTGEFCTGGFNRNEVGKWIPLYAQPQEVAPRQWVGLTEKDKQIAFDDTQEGGGFWEFADAIEAKLKAKNSITGEKE